MGTVDLLLLITYLVVTTYFFGRWLRFRRPPSLGVALLPSGWILIALEGALRDRMVDAVKWCGVVLGVILMALVISADRQEGAR